MKQQLLAFKELLRRYGLIGIAAWRVRNEMDPPQRLSHELAFLPAHLELQDSPVSAAPQWTLRLLLALCALSVLWAAIGQLDIVALAPGKVVPSGRVKVIQPLEPGVVRQIHVRDGQKVSAGQLLIELDPTVSAADLVKSQEAHISARLARARAEALQIALEHERAPQLAPLPEIPAERQELERHLMQTQWAEFSSKRAAQQAELSKRQAELATTRRQVAKLEKTLPYITQRAHDYQQLLAKNFVARHGYLDLERERVTQEQDLAVQRGRVGELRAAIHAQQQLLQSLGAEFRRQQWDSMHQAQQQSVQTGEEQLKARQRQAQTQLRAPVEGRVQQLAVHTIGGVVSSAQPLLVIVPDNTLEVEATIENKDIGFIQTGQDVTVKIEAFPYTRYGSLSGTVAYLSHDALNDEKQGLVFRAHIQLTQDRMRIDRQTIRLTPGMAVSAEIKTGRRRVLEYFLSPVLEHLDEGLRER